ncbi:uroporphyrinogen decarboxylase family protein [Desulfosporosinus youngiae]|uniref:Uroporphyrinogen-III decarboxylase n=1 Tax=Desulfosporosinus youngiae DSM 17734 TaxID=768710 RepID=H5Y3F1_9FIRM|nr:uroporphyrinogen decarboxylase family protein [Desulfosporosinus youngiae]EHQ89060.1 uroporphyrinogen-III decarboxylase [Desulfosporosinus youngiae DSM 17734]
MPAEKDGQHQAKLKRYTTAMDMGKPDKVPIRLNPSEFVAKHVGLSPQEIYYELDKNMGSVNKFLKDFDIDAILSPPSLWWASMHDAVGAVYYRFAGRQLEENRQFQYVEGEYMEANDYDDFIADPTKWILNNFLPRIHEEFAEPGSYRANIALIKGAIGFMLNNGAMQQGGASWAQEFGVTSAISGIGKAPFDTLGDTLRGLTGVMLDMRKQPDKVTAAMDMLISHNAYFAMATAGGDTVLPAFFPLHRGSYPFLNPKQWDTFYWPSLKAVIEELWNQGKRVLFYAEGNWTPYLEKIAELPDKSIVFHVDTTDMAKAKEILGGRFCLSGNVPNTLMAYGKPEEVSEYCKRLIDEYAQDGGFIMDTGGVMQMDVKAENMEALIEATRKYGVY